MNIQGTYDYLCRARHDLWAVLEQTPDEILSKPVLDGSRFHCIKDLVLHIAAVEDSWLHEDILRDTPIWEAFPKLERASEDGTLYAEFPLTELLDYWRAVEASTLAYLPTLTDTELQRPVQVGDKTHTVDGLLWHVLTHEMRHTAQIGVLLRLQGVKPPFLDLLNYLPTA